MQHWHLRWGQKPCPVLPETPPTRVRRADAWLTPPPYQPDVIVGNPPWGVMLSAEAREAVARLPLARLVLGRGEVCSAALFLVLASLWVRPGGIVSLVLPETWLGTQRAEPLRRWLCDEIDLLSVDVLRKSVFPAAPDMVPTVVTLRARPAGGSVTVRRYGWRRPLVPDEPLTWSVVGSLARADWRREPLAVPALGSEPELLALWARLAALPGRLADEVEIHDGVYKSRLMPLLAPGAHRVIATAAEVRPGRVAWAGLTTDEVGWDRLRPADRTRAAQPKVLCHALRKPALADRLVAAVDPAGEYVVSNNLVQLIPRAGSRW